MSLNHFSSFITSLFAELDRSNISYVIIRNYKDYPDKIGGDIDLSIDKKQKNEVIKVFKKITKIHHYCIIRLLKFPHMISVKIINNNAIGNGRSILAFDLFFGFTYRGLEYLEFSQLLKYKERYRNFYVVDDFNSQIITLLHYIFYNNKIPVKYRKRIKELLLKYELPATIKNIVLENVLKQLQNTNFNWELLLKNRNSFLKKLFIYNIKKNNIKIIILFFETLILYLKKIFYLNKFIIIIEPDKNKFSIDHVNKTLEWVHKYHVFSKSSAFIDRLNLITFLRILKISFNEGLIILSINKNNLLIKKIFSLFRYTVIYYTFDNNTSSKIFFNSFRQNISLQSMDIESVILKTLFMKYCKEY